MVLRKWESRSSPTLNKEGVSQGHPLFIIYITVGERRLSAAKSRIAGSSPTLKRALQETEGLFLCVLFCETKELTQSSTENTQRSQRKRCCLIGRVKEAGQQEGLVPSARRSPPPPHKRGCLTRTPSFFIIYIIAGEAMLRYSVALSDSSVSLCETKKELTQSSTEDTQRAQRKRCKKTFSTAR